MDKANLILNSTIELVDVQEEGNGKGRPFVSRFLEPGIAHYKELGDILITKETLNKFIHTMVGCPVIIEHEDVTDENADKLRVGVVSRVWFNEMDGYFYCEGILTDPEAIDLVKNQGYNVSCAYSFVSDNTKKTHNGKEIDMEFIDGEFLHLALVKDPRYEGANIVVNKNDDDLEWITVKGNHIPIKKGQSKDEAVKEFLKDKESKKEEKKPAFKPVKGIMQSLKDDYEAGKINAKEVAKELSKANLTPYLLDDDEALEKIGVKQSGTKDKSGDGETNTIRKLMKASEEYKEAGLMKQSKYFEQIVQKIRGGKKLAPEEYYDIETVLMGKHLDRDYKEKYENKYKNKSKGNNKANNSIGDITMTVLNDLTDFIKKVVKNEKDEEMKEVKNEDKRKLIDEVGGILKGKVDEELWRTVIGKLEKVAYEPSEDSKADNEDDEEKEAKNKCKNEDDEKDAPKDSNDKDEKDEKVTENEDEEEDKKEDKEDKAENKKVKNSMKDIVMGGSSQAQTQKLYTSRKERLEEGNKY